MPVADGIMNPERAAEAPVALITGASRGIGFAIADALGKAGYAMTIVSRSPERLAVAEKELRNQGYDVQSVPADLQHETEILKLVRQHRAHFGRLDVLVNNAGFGISAPLEAHTTQHVDLLIGVNLRAVILMYRECLGMLERSPNGLVINISSLAGKVGTEFLSVYSAVKHGVVGFTQAMNRELADRGIRSCVVCPGYVDTDLAAYIRDEVPPQEMIQPSDIVQLVNTLLTLSPWCAVPEIVMTRPGERFLR